MGLGLSIARKSALLSGGDILLVKGELGGAGFRVLLPVRPMASKRVLIVDDEENIGRSLRMILEREGYAVNVCKSVAEFGRIPTPPRRRLHVRHETAGRQWHRPAARHPPERRRLAGHHDFRPRHHCRRGGGHARRGLRLPGEAAQPRPRPAGREERHRARQSAAGERASPRVGGRRAEHDRLQPGLVPRRGAGHAWRPAPTPVCC